MKKTLLLREEFLPAGGEGLLELDEDNHIVRNVKVVGLHSKNKRRYLSPALQEAVSKYEGVKINIDHVRPPPPGEKAPPREFISRFGRLTRPRMTPSGIRADLVFNPEHPYAKTFLWWVKNDPTAIGLSHNAVCVVYENDHGETIVEKIQDVKSVDLVADPATTAGLLEAVDPDKSGGMDFDLSSPDTAAGPDEEDDAACDHLCNAADAITRDKGLSKKEKLSKLRKLLGLIHDDKKMETEQECSTGKVMESVAYIDKDELDKLMQELDTLRTEKGKAERRAAILRECETAKLPREAVSEVFVTELMEAQDEGRVRALIEDRKALHAASLVRRPVSAAPSPPADRDTLMKNFLKGFQSE